jgi:aminopeptidase N
MTRRLLAALTLTLAVAVLPASAHAAIGSDGLGDPYFPKAGNGGYDVGSYDLELDYTPRKNLLVGRATIAATATIDLDRFNLDFREALKVRSVSVDGVAASFEQAGQELVVTPAAQIPSGSQFTVEVAYRGKPEPVEDPDGSFEGWVATKDGSFAPNEPQGSPSWYPCNDYPTDKATFSFAITVPEGLEAVSNGVLQGKSSSDGRTTWRWEESFPMATYLATAATGNFKISRSQNGPAPGLYAVDPAVRRRERKPTKAARPLERTPRITGYLANQFGSYPFAALGGIVDRVPKIPYALETQSRPVYTELPGTGLVVHEMAHQWYGNSVTISSWPDIWLNEGFATFAEWLYAEDHGGPSGRKIFDGLYELPNRNDEAWRPPPGDPGGAKHLFAGSIYSRGAMTLQALREKVGNGVFFTILRAWASEHAYGNVSTPEFIALAERESGQELDEFFRIWLYEPEKPRDW